ncbi:hypothetical protein COU54_02505 [Candidatus Pacearchaeota archaeon CG10_big_fil_rev_8_21_14_0_10_31_24]|nr:MAG: hypothetical protein COU54_02505 [Candidatus Pacearchaeota archaeon CG10_big_fil_rev_8_21_14_0_10_31_24]
MNSIQTQDSIQTQEITGRDDFELLEAGRDIIKLNSQPVLYQGTDNDHLKVLRRVGRDSAVETTLNKQYLVFASGGIKVDMNIQGAVIHSQTYDFSGFDKNFQTSNLSGFDRLSKNNYDRQVKIDKLELLSRAGL